MSSGWDLEWSRREQEDVAVMNEFGLCSSSEHVRADDLCYDVELGGSKRPERLQ